MPTALTQPRGIGDLTAGNILARFGDIVRFRYAGPFASYTGTAPIEVSSGDVVRHRLSRAGDRQLNCCLHTMPRPKSGTTAPAGTTTCANAQRAKGTKKRCAA